MIRNTRAYIRAPIPRRRSGASLSHFPSVRFRPVRPDLGTTYGGFYDEIVSAIDALAFAPYNLESYRKKSAIVVETEHQFEARPRRRRSWGSSRPGF